MADSQDLLRYSTSSGMKAEGGASDTRSERRHEGGVAPSDASGATSERHVLFDELDAASPRWRHDWKTLRDAAQAYGLHELYADFLQTPAGVRYTRLMRGVHDTIADNEKARAEHEAEIGLAVRAGFTFRSTE